jgi:septum formation protein
VSNLNQAQLVLASASPRRKQLLEQLGWLVHVHAVEIDESPTTNEPAKEYCLRMAKEKGQLAATAINNPLPIVTADTTVVFQDEILGKPCNEEDALLMLKKLSGNLHQVYTAVAVSYQGQVQSVVNVNEVKFAKINEALIKAYIETGEPMDKAGAYGIQGFAAMWVESIVGSYSGIMGLPLYETTQLLNNLDIIQPLDVLKTS